MTEIGAKFGGTEWSLLDAFAIGVSKQVAERVLSPVIGNGTYMSGAIKLAGAYAIHSVAKGNKIGKYVAYGLVIDGVEDVVVNLLGGAGGGAGFLGGLLGGVGTQTQTMTI